jgi:leucyl-tRNA synthetase
MFMGPLESTKPWSMQGVEGISRFLNRAWRMIVDESADAVQVSSKVARETPPSEGQLRVLHKTIRSVTQDMASLSFNTAISRLMEFVNYFTGQNARPLKCMEDFVLMLAPLAPHISEELWRALGHAESLAFEPWPVFDPKYVQESEIEMPVQINGKVRGRITVPAGASSSDIEQSALDDPRVKKYLEGFSVRKVIVIPLKLINIVGVGPK